MRTLLLVTTSLFLISCDSHPVWCDDGKAHQWTKWEDKGGINELGYIFQARYCKVCGVVQIEGHK